MEERQQAKLLYIKARKYENLGQNTQNDLRTTVQKLVKRSLNSVDHKSRFMFQEFPSMINKTVACGKFLRFKTSEAFILLERYLILLLTFPWKKEFQKLKTYSGFLQCRIKSHLEDPEMVFKLIGFREDRHSTLTLYGYPDHNLISDVAFECLVASVECELIAEYHRCIAEKGGDILDAVRFRLEGHAPDFSKKRPKQYVDYVDCKSDIAGSDPGRALQQRGISNTLNNIPKGLPFIDEDFGVNETEVAPAFQVGTVDDHMMASLQKLNSQPQRNEVGNSRNSEEWSFVRTGLESKYGKRYYDGVRGDVINSSNRHDGPAHVVHERDDFSDEGIDINEASVLPTKEQIPIRHVARLQPRGTGFRPSVDTTVKSSFVTSGYRSGQYPLHVVVDPPQNSTLVTCDTAPLSPGGTTHSSGYGTHSHVPVTAQPVTRQLDNGTRYTPSAYINHLPNIDRLSRGGASSAFRMEELKNRSSNLTGESSAAFELERLKNRSSNLTGESSAAFELELLKNRSSNLTDGRILNERWMCKSCTMDNHPKSNVCSVCHKSRRNSVDMDGPRVGDSVRVCSKCTLENEPGSTACSACDTDLAPTNINTYV